MEIQVTPTKLDGVLIVDTLFQRDERGFFIETYHRANYAAHGIAATFVQDNHSRSARGVLRGLHYQAGDAPQAKFVRCPQGAIYDVAVDIRAGSPTFGQWEGVELSGENMRQLFVPAGFAHGFVALTDTADVMYKCDTYYAPQAEGSIRWNDPEIGVQWPVAAPTLSGRDQEAPSLRDYLAAPAFRYRG